MKHHIFAKRSIEHLIDNLLWIHPLVIILVCHQGIPDYDGLFGTMYPFFVAGKLVKLFSDHLMGNEGAESVITKCRLVSEENTTRGEDEM